MYKNVLLLGTETFWIYDFIGNGYGTWFSKNKITVSVGSGFLIKQNNGIGSR